MKRPITKGRKRKSNRNSDGRGFELCFKLDGLDDESNNDPLGIGVPTIESISDEVDEEDEDNDDIGDDVVDDRSNETRTMCSPSLSRASSCTCTRNLSKEPSTDAAAVLDDKDEVASPFFSSNSDLRRTTM